MKLAVDKRFGVVVVKDDSIGLAHTQLGVPDNHPDPLLWLIEQSDHLARLDSLRPDTLEYRNLDTSQLTAPLARPSKVIAAPVNYLDHKLEMHEQQSVAEFGLFLKANSSVVGPGAEVRLPYTDKRVDHEAELGVVVGRRARAISYADALDYVFGYTCLLDISLRSTEDRSTRKSFDTFTPIGPHIVTKAEVPDPGDLELSCWVDGVLRQHASTRDLIFDVPLLLAYASSVMTLEPGDIIATGTPAGVGPINDARQIRMSIEGVGELVVDVSSEGAVAYADRPHVL